MKSFLGSNITAKDRSSTFYVQYYSKRNIHSHRDPWTQNYAVIAYTSSLCPKYILRIIYLRILTVTHDLFRQPS